MGEITKEINYDALVREFREKDDAMEESENARYTEELEYWSVTTKLLIDKSKFNNLNEVNWNLRNEITSKLASMKTIDKEKHLFDQQLKHIQEFCKQIEINRAHETEAFHKNVEVLQQQFAELSANCNIDLIKPDIVKYQKQIGILHKKIATINEKLQVLKTLSNKNEYLTPPGLKEVTESLKKECMERYGDPKALQRELQRAAMDIKKLQNEINEAKAKSFS